MDDEKSSEELESESKQNLSEEDKRRIEAEEARLKAEEEYRFEVRKRMAAEEMAAKQLTKETADKDKRNEPRRLSCIEKGGIGFFSILGLFLLFIFLFTDEGFKSSSKKRPQKEPTLNATVNKVDQWVEIINNDSFAWTSVRVCLNGWEQCYEFDRLNPNQSHAILTKDFVDKKGTRFNLRETKILEVWIRANVPGGTAYRGYEFN